MQQVDPNWAGIMGSPTGQPKPPQAGPAQQVQPWTNNVQADPYLTENIDWIRERRDASNVQNQKARAFGDIDTLSKAQGKSIESQLARRGMGGSGAGIEAQAGATDAAARAKVRAGMDIDQAEQGRQDALALGASGIMKAPSQYALGQQGLNLQQMQANQGQQNWLAQFQAQQQQGAMDNYMKMLQIFQNEPQGSPYSQGSYGSYGGGSYGGGAGIGGR